MERRNLLKLLGATGLSLALPWAPRRAFGADEAYPGPYYVMINAGGGWDPRFTFDPSLDVEQNRLYTAVGKVGNISCATIPVDLAQMGLDATYDYDTRLLDNATFLERHGARLLVINGVDMKTNNHDAGTRAIWSGKLQEGYPTLGALIAAARAPEHPMTFLSAGGFDATEGLVPLTRVGSADDMQRLAFPNRVNPTDPENLELYHAGTTQARIEAAQRARLEALLDKERLPRLRQSMSELTLARARVGDLQSLTIPGDLVTIPGYQLGALQNNMRQAQIAIAAFQAGLAACLNLDIGGFDTHGNHDRDQWTRTSTLLALVDFVITRLDDAGLLDRTTVFVGSDFARGPFYNGANDYDGKDHWPIGSFWALGAGVRGNRVIGGTTPDQRARRVDPTTLEAVDSGGVELTVESLHHAIRELAGVGAMGDAFP
ncbi:MAG TPA: DUF1501 domain-containing protein, partial [Polyangiaceae bacterium]|nr:DUF1501 domain-containing protein [Polyangiaceae bacterium]